jgi:hypothetical protein
MGSFLSSMAGAGYILNFIPPSPSNPPSLPGIGLFTAPMMGALALPSNFPSLNISLGGISIPIPGQGGGSPPFDISAYLKMIAVAIALPFLLVKTMIEKLLQLQVVLPTPSGVQSLLGGLFAEAGLNTPAITKLTGCLATGVAGIFTSTIPA